MKLKLALILLNRVEEIVREVRENRQDDKKLRDCYYFLSNAQRLLTYITEGNDD